MNHIDALIKSKKAAEVNLKIMRAFVEMRRFLISNAAVFEKLHKIDQKLLEHDESFDKQNCAPVHVAGGIFRKLCVEPFLFI